MYAENAADENDINANETRGNGIQHTWKRLSKLWLTEASNGVKNTTEESL